MRPPRPYRQRLEEIQKRREGIIERARSKQQTSPSSAEQQEQQQQQQQLNATNNNWDAVIDLTAFEEDMARGGCLNGIVKGAPIESRVESPPPVGNKESRKDAIAPSRRGATEFHRGMIINKTTVMDDHGDGRTPSKMDIAREQDLMRDDDDDFDRHSQYYEGYERRQATPPRRFFPDDDYTDEHGTARPKHGSEIVLLESMDSDNSSAYLQSTAKSSVAANKKLPSNSNTIFRPTGTIFPMSNPFLGNNNPEQSFTTTGVGVLKVGQPFLVFDGLEHIRRGKEYNEEDTLTIPSGAPEKPVLLLDDMDGMKKPYEDEGSTVKSGAPDKPVDLTNDTDQVRHVGSAEKPVILMDDWEDIRSTRSQSLSTAAIHTISPSNSHQNFKGSKVKHETEQFRRMKSAEESAEFLEVSIEKSRQVPSGLHSTKSSQTARMPSGSPTRGISLKHSPRVGSPEKPMVLLEGMERVHMKASLESPRSPEGPSFQLESPRLDSTSEDDSATVQSGTKDKPVVLFEGMEKVEDQQCRHDQDSTYASRGGRMNEKNDHAGSINEESQVSGRAIYRRALRRHGGRKKLERRRVFIPQLHTVEEPVSPDRETQSPDGFDEEMESHKDTLIDAEEETNSIIEESVPDAQNGDNEIELEKSLDSIQIAPSHASPTSFNEENAKDHDSPVAVSTGLALSPVSSVKSGGFDGNDDIAAQPISSPTPSVDKLELSSQEETSNPSTPISTGNAIGLRSNNQDKLEVPSRGIAVTYPLTEDMTGDHALPDINKDTNEEKKSQPKASFIKLPESSMRSNETEKPDQGKEATTSTMCFVGGCIAPVDPPGDSIRNDGVEVKDNSIVTTLLKEMEGAKEKCNDKTFDIKTFFTPEKTAERLERLRQRLAASTTCQRSSTPSNENSEIAVEEGESVNINPRLDKNQGGTVQSPKEVHGSRQASMPTDVAGGEPSRGADLPNSLPRESRYVSHSSPIEVLPQKGDHDSSDSSTPSKAVSGVSSGNQLSPDSAPRTTHSTGSKSMPPTTFFGVPSNIPSDEMEPAMGVNSLSRPYSSYNLQGNSPMQVSSLEFSDPEGVSKIVETARNSLGKRNDSFDAITSFTSMSQPANNSKHVIRLDYEDFKKVVTGRSVSQDDPFDKSVIQLLDRDDEVEVIPKKPKKDLNISDYETPSSGVSSGDDSPGSGSSSSEDGRVREGVAESSDSSDAKVSVEYSQHSESDLDTNYDMYDTCAVPFLTKFFVKSCDWLERDPKSPSLLHKTKKRAAQEKRKEKQRGKAGEAALRVGAFDSLEKASRKLPSPRKRMKVETTKKLSPYARPRGIQQKHEHLSVQHGDQSELNSSSDSSLARSTTFQKKLQGRLESIRTQTPPFEGSQSEASHSAENKEAKDSALSLREKLQERLKNTATMKQYPTPLPYHDGHKSGSDAENMIVLTGTDLSKGATSKEPNTVDQFLGRRARLFAMAGGPEGINSRSKKAEIVFEKISKASPRPSPTSIVPETNARSPNSSIVQKTSTESQTTGAVAKKASWSPSRARIARKRSDEGSETHTVNEATSWSPARSHVSDFVTGGNRSTVPISPENIAKQMSWSPTRAGRYQSTSFRPKSEVFTRKNLTVNTNVTVTSAPVNSKGSRSPRKKSKSPRKTVRSPRRISPSRSSLSKKSSTGSKSSSHASLPDDIEDNLSDTIASLNEEERLQALELVEKLRRRAATLKRRRQMRQRRMKQLEEMSNSTPDDDAPSSRDPPAADAEKPLHKSPRMSGPPQPEVQV